MKYFVSIHYVCENSSFGFTNMDIDTKNEINSIKQIREIEVKYFEYLKSSGMNPNNVTVIQYNLLSK